LEDLGIDEVIILKQI